MISPCKVRIPRGRFWSDQQPRGETRRHPCGWSEMLVKLSLGSDVADRPEFRPPSGVRSPPPVRFSLILLLPSWSGVRTILGESRG